METETGVSPPATPPHQRLAGKVAIITGGASGIGAATAQIFHENGAKVVIADIQDAQGQALAEKLGQNVSYIHCNVQNEDEIINLIDKTVTKYGKLDIMYNNAGIVDRPFSTILDATKPDFDRLMSVNLIGAFLGAKHAARVMIPRQKGCILFTSSACTAIGGLATQTYAVTKHGIWGLAENLAAELKQHKITVNCISPLGVVTAINGKIPEFFRYITEVGLSSVGNLKGQILKAEDVGKAALYLASDEGNCVSGINFLVDGGFSSVNPSMARALGPWMRTFSLILRLSRSSKPTHFLTLLICLLALCFSLIMFF